MKKYVNGKLVDLTEQEISDLQAYQTTVDAEIAAEQWKINRMNAYKALGWNDEFDLMDDILKRGIDAVKADRDAIKTQYPKGNS